MRVAGLVLAMAMLALATGARAGPTLEGDTVDAAMIRTIDTGYGLEGPFVVVNGPADVQQYSEHYLLDIDGDHFTVDFLGQFTSGWQEGTVLRLSDLDFSGTSFLSGLNIDTNLVGYTLTFGSNYIDIGLGGTEFSGSTYFNATFKVSQVTAIPEPATLALMAVGLLGVASAAKRSRRRLR
jgi:hypothetical protein